MSKVHSRGSRCERVLRAALVQLGTRGFRMHYGVTGKPDFAFPDCKLAVFCDSAFWHGHRPLPTSNTDYWHPKIARNRARDSAVTRELEHQGWKVIRLREAQILESPKECALEILRYLKRPTALN